MGFKAQTHPLRDFVRRTGGSLRGFSVPDSQLKRLARDVPRAQFRHAHGVGTALREQAVIFDKIIVQNEGHGMRVLQTELKSANPLFSGRRHGNANELVEFEWKYQVKLQATRQDRFCNDGVRPAR